MAQNAGKGSWRVRPHFLDLPDASRNTIAMNYGFLRGLFASVLFLSIGHGKLEACIRDLSWSMLRF